MSYTQYSPFIYSLAVFAIEISLEEIDIIKMVIYSRIRNLTKLTIPLGLALK